MSVAERLLGIKRELGRAAAFADDTRSAARLCSDMLLVRATRRLGRDRTGAIRAVGGDGLEVSYRLNSGDLQSIREVLLDEAYRLPMAVEPGVLVDLGANIGLTSLWLQRRYGFRRVIAVEPLPANVSLATRNLERNGLDATILRAAVGPKDGVVTFAQANASNLGRVGAGDLEVPMVSMQTVLSHLPEGAEVDLVKMDIEGGEQALLVDGDLAWLRRVRAFVVEFHPPVIDHPRLIGILKANGFRYIPPNTAFSNSPESFVRASA